MQSRKTGIFELLRFDGELRQLRNIIITLCFTVCQLDNRCCLQAL